MSGQPVQAFGTLNETEFVIITINEFLPDEVEGPPQTLMISNSEERPSINSVELLDGTYKIEARLFDMAPHVIPAEERCVDPNSAMFTVLTGGLSSLFMSKECYWSPPEPGTEMDVVITGGALLDDTTGYWQISRDSLAGSKEIEFFLITVPKPTYLEDLANMDAPTNLSIQYRHMIEPVLT